MLSLLLSCAAPPAARAPVEPSPTTPAPAPAPAPDQTPPGTPPVTPEPTGDTAPPPTAPARLFAYVGAADDHIHVYAVDAATGALTEVSSVDAGSNPSFLAFSADLGHVYAVNESSDELAAFALDPASGALTFLNRVGAGRGPAHLTVAGGFVLAADYGGGDVTVHPILGDGSLGAQLAAVDTGPNAHQVLVDPTERWAFVPNLGSDEVSQLVFDPVTGALVPNAVPAVALPDGPGPRHLALHPNAPFAYVIGELGDTMTALSYDASTGRLGSLSTVSTLPAGVDGDDNSTAEVAFGADGRFLYGSNRGHDSLVVFAVDPATGALAQVAHQPTGGSWPRHFSLSPDGGLLLVANQRSDNVVAFRVDPKTGLLTELATTPTAPGPAFVGVVALPQSSG